MSKAETKNTGIEDMPKKGCSDITCPSHGGLKLRGRLFTGSVISAKMKKTAVIEFDRLNYINKYERYEKRRTRLKAHNPDCISAKEGDVVKIMECRPLSKTKNFVIIQKLGVEKGFKDRMEAREAAKIVKEEEKSAE